MLVLAVVLIEENAADLSELIVTYASSSGSNASYDSLSPSFGSRVSTNSLTLLSLFDIINYKSEAIQRELKHFKQFNILTN